MYKVPDVISQNGLKAMRFEYRRYGDNTIEVLDLSNQNVLHKRVDNPGLHLGGSFNEDDKVVIYFTCDTNWYIPPIIKIWDLTENTLKEIISGLHPQAMNFILSYHNTSRIFVVADPLQGIVCAYNLSTLELLWQNKTSDIFENNKIIALDITECGELVAVLQDDKLTVYHLMTGEVLLTTPLLEQYLCCLFNSNAQCLELMHSHKASIKISYKPLLSDSK